MDNDFDQITKNWVAVEQWMSRNGKESDRWFSASEIAADLKLDQTEVEKMLNNHFEAQSVERRSDGKRGFSYCNFQYKDRAKLKLRTVQLKITVEANRDELHSAVHQVIHIFTANEWEYIDLTPDDYNNRDRAIKKVNLLFASTIE